MTIDMFTNLRLVRSWGLLEQSSDNLKRSAEQLQSGQRIQIETDSATGLAIPESARSRWRSGLESVPASPECAEGIEATCEALGSLERVLSHLLRVTQLAVDGEMAKGSQAAIEQDLTVIGSCLRRIQAVGHKWDISDLREGESEETWSVADVADGVEDGEGEDPE